MKDMKDMKKCTRCGEQIQDSAIKCIFCGEGFDLKEKKTIKPYVKIGIGLYIIIIFIFIRNISLGLNMGFYGESKILIEGNIGSIFNSMQNLAMIFSLISIVTFFKRNKYFPIITIIYIILLFSLDILWNNISSEFSYNSIIVITIIIYLPIIIYLLKSKRVSKIFIK